jgi:hypothetical protein
LNHKDVEKELKVICSTFYLAAFRVVAVTRPPLSVSLHFPLSSSNGFPSIRVHGCFFFLYKCELCRRIFFPVFFFLRSSFSECLFFSRRSGCKACRMRTAQEKSNRKDILLLRFLQSCFFFFFDFLPCRVAVADESTTFPCSCTNMRVTPNQTTFTSPTGQVCLPFFFI